MPAERLDLSRYRFSGPLGHKKEHVEAPSVAESEHTPITPEIESIGRPLYSTGTIPDDDASHSQAVHAQYPTDGTAREKYRNTSGKVRLVCSPHGVAQRTRIKPAPDSISMEGIRLPHDNTAREDHHV